MARLPAFQPLVPGPAETLAALGLTLAAAGVGGVAARRLADVLAPGD